MSDPADTIKLMPDEEPERPAQEVLPPKPRPRREYAPAPVIHSTGQPYPMPKVDLDEIEMMASVGMTVKQIADALHLSPSIFGKLVKNDPLVQEAIDRGTARGVKMVTDALFQNALKGNVAAQIFFLKNKAQWADKQELDQRLQVETKMSFDDAVQALKAAGIDPDKV